jgi:Zn-finger domain-containing protein
MLMTVSAKKSDNDRVVSTTYDFGATLDESIEKFGEAVVHGVFIDQATIRLQALLRRCIDDETSDKDIQAKVDQWKMTVGGRERKSASEKVHSLLEKMSPEQKAELLKSLRGGGK